VQIADSRNFLANRSIAASLVTLRPGALRELHWHPNADEWQYYIKGKAQVGVSATCAKAQTTNFSPGDIGYVKRNNGHYVKKSATPSCSYSRYSGARILRTSLLVRLVVAHTARRLVAATFNMDPAMILNFSEGKPEILPG
jgi:oxalate decarboxylase